MNGNGACDAFNFGSRVHYDYNDEIVQLRKGFPFLGDIT